MILLEICSELIQPSTAHVGVWLGPELSLKQRVAKIAGLLGRVVHTKNALTATSPKYTLVVIRDLLILALLMSRLDYRLL